MPRTAEDRILAKIASLEATVEKVRRHQHPPERGCPCGRIINVDNPGRTIYIAADDPTDSGHSPDVGDVWIKGG